MTFKLLALSRLSRFISFIRQLFRYRFVHLKWPRDVLISALKGMEIDGFAPSVYGPCLRANWPDSSFLMAVSGSPGFKLHDLLLRPSQKTFVLIDIGANYGLYSLIALRNPQCVAAHAVEPNPDILDYLDQNVARNQLPVTVHKAGIGDENGQSTFSYRTTNTGRGSLVQEFDRTVTIDLRNFSLLDEIGAQHPDDRFFLKVDVEGYEPHVIRQVMKSKITGRIDNVFIEISPAWLTDEEISTIFVAMENLGLKEVWRSPRSEQYDVLFSRPA